KNRVSQRLHELLLLKAVPEKDVFAADAELKQAELALSAAQSKQASLSVEGAGQNLFWVRAPRAGVLVDVDVTPSEGVTAEREKPLMKISDLDEVVVYADVQENDSADIAVGSKVTIHEQIGNFDRQGTVEHISEVIDPRRRTVEVRVHAQNLDHALKP